MAAQDRAILVGISRYSDQSFGALNGPPNDVQRMRTWLLSPDGGDVPAQHIVTLTSPASIPADTDPDDWEPAEHHFQRAYARTVTDPQTRAPIRRDGRLYLYFSGHGFSERRDQTTQAAIFAANATRFFPNNICGTIFALAAREQALFKEIVLIMDCCRDAELNLPFSKPAINAGTSDAAPDVRFMALYAAPKGGKAQERSFAELNGMTCGLLTHAFLRSLKETPPDRQDGVSSTAIKQYLFSTWADVCGNIPAAEPEFVSPTGTDIEFPVAAKGVLQGFKLTQAPVATVTLEIFDALRESVVQCVFTPGVATMTSSRQPPAPLLVVGLRFELRLQPGLYRCVASGGMQKSVPFEATGVTDVDI
jgi:Caspase domain